MLEHLTDNRYAAIEATNNLCTGCWYDRFLFDILNGRPPETCRRR